MDAHQKPPASHGHPITEGPWSTGLCDCFSDVPNCCLTCWCPCVTFGQVAEIVDQGSTSCGGSGAVYTLIVIVTGCGCLYSCFYRQRMRKLYMLSEILVMIALSIASVSRVLSAKSIANSSIVDSTCLSDGTEMLREIKVWQ